MSLGVVSIDLVIHADKLSFLPFLSNRHGRILLLLIQPHIGEKRADLVSVTCAQRFDIAPSQLNHVCPKRDETLF